MEERYKPGASGIRQLNGRNLFFRGLLGLDLFACALFSWTILVHLLMHLLELLRRQHLVDSYFCAVVFLANLALQAPFTVVERKEHIAVVFARVHI